MVERTQSGEIRGGTRGVPEGRVGSFGRQVVCAGEGNTLGERDNVHRGHKTKLLVLPSGRRGLEVVPEIGTEEVTIRRLAAWW